MPHRNLRGFLVYRPGIRDEVQEQGTDHPSSKTRAVKKTVGSIIILFGIDGKSIVATLALLDPEPVLDSPLLTQKVIDLQLYQVGDAQRRVDTNHKQQ